MTLIQSLEILIKQLNIVDILLTNLKDYCGMAKAKLTSATPNLDNRKKLYLVNQKFTHNDEIDERL
jgi:hypothetical protein